MSNVLWVEADALLTEAREGEGDQTWHTPLFQTAKPHSLYTKMYYFLF